MIVAAWHQRREYLLRTGLYEEEPWCVGIYTGTTQPAQVTQAELQQSFELDFDIIDWAKLDTMDFLST